MKRRARHVYVRDWQPLRCRQRGLTATTARRQTGCRNLVAGCSIVLHDYRTSSRLQDAEAWLLTYRRAGNLLCSSSPQLNTERTNDQCIDEWPYRKMHATVPYLPTAWPGLQYLYCTSPGLRRAPRQYSRKPPPLQATVQHGSYCSPEEQTGRTLLIPTFSSRSGYTATRLAQDSACI